MNTAFQITEEDLANVLQQHGISLSEERTSDIFDEHIAPAADEIEAAALRGTEMEQQTTYAYEVITELLRRAGIIPMPADA